MSSEQWAESVNEIMWLMRFQREAIWGKAKK
jgi:hypothetical protein